MRRLAPFRSSRAWRLVGPAVPGWVAARVLVAFSFLAANLAFDHLRPRALGVEMHLHEGLLGWDARWYENIASFGYADLPRVGLRFFPLFPLLGRLLGGVLFGHRGLALVLVANGAALVLGVLLHRLCVQERGDAGLGRRAAWLVAVVPSAYVLVWGYSEALAGCLAVACFMALRRRRWWWAAVAGLLAGLVRPVGMLLALPAAVEAARGLRSAPAREWVARGAAVLGAPLGCGLYLAWVGVRFGHPFLPLSVQQAPDFRGGVTNPVGVLWKAADGLLEGRLDGNTVHLPWAVVAIVLVALVFRWWPLSYGVFAAASLAVALSTERLGSFERYAFAPFPVVLTLAVLAGAGWSERLLLVIGGATMTGYATLALLGVIVP